VVEQVTTSVEGHEMDMLTTRHKEEEWTARLVNVSYDKNKSPVDMNVKYNSNGIWKGW
jgi:hypothetical protein